MIYKYQQQEKQKTSKLQGQPEPVSIHFISLPHAPLAYNENLHATLITQCVEDNCVSLTTSPLLIMLHSLIAHTHTHARTHARTHTPAANKIL